MVDFCGLPSGELLWVLHSSVGSCELFRGLSVNRLQPCARIMSYLDLDVVCKSEYQSIGLKEILQENPICHGKIYGFL